MYVVGELHGRDNPAAAKLRRMNKEDLSLRIAQIAPLFESVPPKLYGGTERVIAYLIEPLVKAGHEVTLFASGDSRTSARLIPVCPAALRLTACRDPLAHHMILFEKVRRMAHAFDIAHFHTDYLGYSLQRQLDIPNVTTLHGRLDLPDLVPLYEEFHDMSLVSISDAQRAPLPGANWRGTVYHGLPRDLYRFHPERGNYLAFIGRISPEKRADRAIAIAKSCGIPLKIAAKIDTADRDYFHAQIEPLLSHPLVEFVGEIGESEKEKFLGGALGLLFPIDWPEPFGLVMIEAMACGTPVVAYRSGSVPEVLEDGLTGFIVQTHEEAVAAVGKLPSLSRERCRQEFEKRFVAEVMAANYLKVYERLMRGRGSLDGRYYESATRTRGPDERELSEELYERFNTV